MLLNWNIVFSLLMEEYAYGNAGVQEWRQLIIEAANNSLAGLYCFLKKTIKAEIYSVFFFFGFIYKSE